MATDDMVRLDLPVLLPDVPDAKDACVHRLTDGLSGREGVHQVHVVESANGKPPRLCVHYDPDVLELPRIRQWAKSLGAEITDQFGHAVWQVDGIRNARHARTIAERLRQMDGMIEAEATAGGRVRLEYGRSDISETEIQDQLRAWDLHVQSDSAPTPDKSPAQNQACGCHTREQKGIWGEQTELVVALLSGVFLAAGFVLSFVGTVPEWGSIALYVGAYAFGGFYTTREALEALRVGRFEVDVLMIVAAVGAAILGRWAEGALLLFLFSLGHALEHYAMGRARQAIESLADLTPETARVRRDGTEKEIPVQALQRGDEVIIRPNERIPADGVVVEGTSSVNQAPVTGESVPVDKTPASDQAAAERSEEVPPEHRVFAGTINGSGALTITVTRRAEETTLARVVEMVREAETHTSPTQRFTNRFERVFVPVVLGLVVLLLFAWIPLDEPFAASFYRAMAVLVASSPCALAIATPSAVLSSVARAGRGGVLVKGGGPLEQLGRLDAIAFDKTGTLTSGEFRVTDVQPTDGVEEDELLRVAVAVERLSDHPLARAVVREGKERLNGTELPEAEALKSMTGRGVQARINGEMVFIGSDALFEEVDGPPLPDLLQTAVQELEANGRSTMVVRRGDRYLGVIGLMDTPRPAAERVVERLRALGIRRMVMISGDNQRVADAVAAELGVDEARGNLLPDDKVRTIKQLSREQEVAMIGDGVNDAPAMANATVGVAMGAAGSDVALETADVALMADELEHLPLAIGLSRQTSRIIRQNVWIALGMVAFLVPATVLGLNIGPAVVLHEGSTLLVVANALRLLGYSS